MSSSLGTSPQTDRRTTARDQRAQRGVVEVGAGGGKLCFGGGLVALELFVALDHGVELAQYASGLSVFFFGAR